MRFIFILLSIGCHQYDNWDNPIISEYPEPIQTTLDYDENFVERHPGNCTATDTLTEECSIYAGECLFLTVEEEQWITGMYDSSLINWI